MERDLNAPEDMSALVRPPATTPPSRRSWRPTAAVWLRQAHVWIGLWGGWRARRYAPTGEILTEVRLPASNITKIAFGGSDLCTIYATSARKGLDAAALDGQPLAGNIFAFDVEVPGLPGNLVRLS